MIWATVSCWCCFCWLYRASPSLDAKNIMSDFGVDYPVMSMCRVFSCVLGRECLLWPVRSLGRTLLPFTLLHSVLQGQVCPRCFLTSYFCIPVLYNEKDIFFWVFVLEGLLGLHRTVQLQLLQCYWSGHRLRLPWYCMVCLGNKQRSFCGFWDFIQVLHFRLFCWLWWLLHFF